MSLTDIVFYCAILLILLGMGAMALALQGAPKRPAARPMSVCPRQRDEAVLPVQREHQTHVTKDGTCSYCGSLTEDLFLKAVRDGCELGPTDKNYKVYVRRPNPSASRQMIVGSANYAHAGYEPLSSRHMAVALASRWTEKDFLEKLHAGKTWVLLGHQPALTHDKFYFQHLSEEGKTEFTRLLNECRVKLGAPGYFYVLPFFLRRADPK